MSKYPILCPNCPILCPNYPENGPGSNQKFSATLWLGTLKNQNWLSKQSSQRIFSIAQSVLELLKKKVLTWTKTCPSSKNVPHIWITTWTQNGANYPKTGPNWSTFQTNSMWWNFIIFSVSYFVDHFWWGIRCVGWEESVMYEFFFIIRLWNLGLFLRWRISQIYYLFIVWTS